MTYCTKCGQELRDGDRFCASCGTPVTNPPAPQPVPQPSPPPSQGPGSQSASPQSAAPQQPYSPQPQPPYPPSYPQPKKPRVGLIIALVGGSVLAAVLIIAAVFSALTGSRGTPPVSPVSSQPIVEVETDPPSEAGYLTYANDLVAFSLEYPEDCQLEEPYTNAVLIQDGSDFRLAAEYTYASLSDSFIYSAEDFALQMEEDPQVLADWLGTDSVEVTDTGTTMLDGMEAYTFAFSVDLPDAQYEGTLYLVEGRGEFGCYSLLTLYNPQAEKAELYREQCAHAADTLCINGPFQTEGYTLYTSEPLGLSFLLRDEAAAMVDVEDPERVTVYPVDGIFTEANVRVRATAYDPDDGAPGVVLKRLVDIQLSEAESRAKGIQVARSAMGRYPFYVTNVNYTEKGQAFTLVDALFEHEGQYWTVTAHFTPEYGETVSQAVSDILFSLRFGEEPGVLNHGSQEAPPEEEGVSINNAVNALLNELEDEEDLSYSSEPLISVTDMDGDGEWEFLVTYVEEDDGLFEVEVELWITQDGGLIQLGEDTLYTQVGGNTGSVGLAKRSGSYYLALYRSSPQEQTFQRYYRYASLAGDRLGDENVLMECRQTYQDDQLKSGKYQVDGRQVDKAAFDQVQEEFIPLLTLDIDKGPGNSGLVMTWDQARDYDFDGSQDDYRINLG